MSLALFVPLILVLFLVLVLCDCGRKDEKD